LLALGDVAQRLESLVADVGEEALAEPRRDAQRHDEAHARGGELADRLRETAGRVTDQQPRTRERPQPLQRRADQRDLGGIARVRTHIHRHAIGAGRLQRADLALDAPVGPPALGDQRRVLIGTGDAQRRQIDVQAADIDPEALNRARRQRAAQRLGLDRQRLQATPEAVVVQQRGRDPEQLLQRGARRPPGDVIQRRRRAQPARDQRRRDLADRQLRAPARRQHTIDRGDQVKLAHELPRQQQRPDIAPNPD
jgi:hypothetical protein